MVDLVLFCFESDVKLHLDDCYVGLVSRVVKLLMFLKDLGLKLEVVEVKICFVLYFSINQMAKS